MPEIHTNNDTGRNLEIPLRNDLRNEMEDNDEKSKCFGHLNNSDQRNRGLFNKILYRIAECIEIHVEVNNKFSALYKCVGDIRYIIYRGTAQLWTNISAFLQSKISSLFLLFPN